MQYVLGLFRHLFLLVSAYFSILVCQGLQWLDQTAVKTVRAPDRTAGFGTP